MKKNLLKRSIASALESFLVALSGLIDVLMIGKLGKESLASVSLTIQPYYLALVLSTSIAIGTGVIISRRKGEKSVKKARTTLKQAIIISLISSFVFQIFLFLFASFILRLCGAQGEVLVLSSLYFRLIILSLFAISTRLVILSAFRASGKPLIPLLINLGANLLNIILNYFLIPFFWVAGAGIATISANVFSLVLAFFALYKVRSFIKFSKKEKWEISFPSMKGIFNVSSFALYEQLFIRIGFFLLAILINYLGSEAIALNAGIISIYTLCFALSEGFSLGCASLIGEALGGKKPQLALKYCKMGLIYNLLISIIMTGLIILVAPSLLKLILIEDELVKKGYKILLISVILIIPQALQWILSNTLRVAGDIKFISFSGIICILLIRPLLAFLLVYPLGLGVLGSYLALGIDQSIRVVINGIRIKQKKWLRIKV